MGAIRDQIRSKMEEKGIGAYALEKKAGLKQSTLQNILYDKSKNPGIYIVQAIAKALNCSVSELLEEENFISSPDKNFLKENLLQASYPWNGHLYLQCSYLISGLLIKKSLYNLKLEDFYDLVGEVYLYSCKIKRNSPDANFAEWLIEKVK